MSIVDKIRALANEKGMSLPDLELEIGLGNGTISRWRNSSPNSDKIQKVADYFEVSVDYLLGRSEIKNPSTNPKVDILQRAGEGLTKEHLDDILSYAKRKYGYAFEDSNDKGEK